MSGLYVQHLADHLFVFSKRKSTIPWVKRRGLWGQTSLGSRLLGVFPWVNCLIYLSLFLQPPTSWKDCLWGLNKIIMINDLAYSVWNLDKFQQLGTNKRSAYTCSFLLNYKPFQDSNQFLSPQCLTELRLNKVCWMNEWLSKWVSEWSGLYWSPWYK